MTMSTCAGPDTAAEADEISLYEAIGGRPALVAAVDLFYRRILADPELSPFFPGGVGDRHRDRRRHVQAQPARRSHRPGQRGTGPEAQRSGGHRARPPGRPTEHGQRGLAQARRIHRGEHVRLGSQHPGR